MPIVILDTVYEKAPFLTSPTDDAKVGKEVERSQIFLQDYLKKTDLQVYIESEYTEKEKLLVAYLTAYNLTTNKATANLTGESGQSPTINRVVKSAKADVVDTEFESPSGANSFMLSMQEIASNLKDLVCDTAAALGITLPMCGCFNAASVSVPFIVVC